MIDMRKALSDITNHEGGINTLAHGNKAKKPVIKQTKKLEVFEDTDIPDREMATLFEELEELHKQNDTITQKYNAQLTSNKKLQEHLEEQTTQIDEFESIIKLLRDQIVDYERKLAAEEQSAAIAIANAGEEKVKSLNQSIAALNTKLKQEEEMRIRMEGVLKTKESNNTKLKERNDRLVKMINGDEKSSKKLADQLKQKEVVLLKITKDLEKEKKLRLDAEKKYSMMEQQVETLQVRLVSSMEDNDSTTKLLELLEDKLQRANEHRDAIAEKLKREEQKRESEAEELCNIREEMTKVCETIIAEKQHSEELEKELDEIRSDHQQIVKELQESKANEKTLKADIERLAEEKKFLSLQLLSVQKDVAEQKKQFDANLQERNNIISELQGRLEQKTSEYDDLKRKEEEGRSKLNIVSQKLVKEQEARKALSESIEKKDSEFASVNEKRVLLQKRLEKELKTIKKLTDEKARLEDASGKAKNIQQELQLKLTKKEKEYERVAAKLELVVDELEKEKQKGDRMWSELEETVKQYRQIQSDKISLEKTSKQAQEIMEHKFNNKITMLEKKCEYLKKMNEFGGRDVVNDEESTQLILREQHERILSLMNDQEKISEILNGMETHLVERERELEAAYEKMRMMEDLLNNEHKRKSSEIKGQASKKLLTLEKCIDEILLEIGAEGVMPSELNSREKALVIVGRIHEQQKELTHLLCDRDQLQDEIQKLTQEVNKPPQITQQIIECNHQHSDEEYERLEQMYSQVVEQCQKYKSWVVKFTTGIKGRRATDNQEESNEANQSPEQSEEDQEQIPEKEEQEEEVVAIPVVQESNSESTMTTTMTSPDPQQPDSPLPAMQLSSEQPHEMVDDRSTPASSPTRSVTSVGSDSQEPVKQPKRTIRRALPSPSVEEEKSQTYSRLFMRNRKK